VSGLPRDRPHGCCAAETAGAAHISATVFEVRGKGQSNDRKQAGGYVERPYCSRALAHQSSTPRCFSHLASVGRPHSVIPIKWGRLFSG
jgi:hypothetical protein